MSPIRQWPWVLAIVAAAGCGGGGDEPPIEHWSGVTIEAPSEAGSFRTTQASIDLAGRAFVPGGSACNALVGTIAPGYTITWRNDANGASGKASDLRLNCLLAVSLTWTAGAIPLAPGLNAITVSANAADGQTGVDRIMVERVVSP